MQCITNSYDYTNWFEKEDKEPADTDIVLKVDKKRKNCRYTSHATTSRW